MFRMAALYVIERLKVHVLADLTIILQHLIRGRSRSLNRSYSRGTDTGDVVKADAPPTGNRGTKDGSAKIRTEAVSATIVPTEDVGGGVQPTAVDAAARSNTLPVSPFQSASQQDPSVRSGSIQLQPQQQQQVRTILGMSPAGLKDMHVLWSL